MRSIRSLAVFAAAALTAIAPAGAAGPPAWELLKSLAGDWEAKTDKLPEPMRISYAVISNGSAVLETMHAKGNHPFMITVYHRDGDRLMLTHYCAGGNQPRMRAVSTADPKRIVFRFLDATNLASPESDHMRDLTLTMPESNHLVQEWTSREAGKDARTVFHLTRTAAAH